MSLAWAMLAGAAWMKEAKATSFLKNRRGKLRKMKRMTTVEMVLVPYSHRQRKLENRSAQIAQVWIKGECADELLFI